MKGLVMSFVVASVIAGQALGAAAQETSALWGKAGEDWTPESRLPDFSYAGYHCGEKPVPDVPQAASVKDFGAVGDGEHDDSQAFLDAIAATERGAIFVPPGRYRITKILWIEKSGVVLRGAGPEKTTLFFPKPLNDIKPNWGATTGGRRTSNYSWSGGFVWFKGKLNQKTLAKVTQDAKRGGRVIHVSDTAGLKPGQWVEILLRDDADATLLSHLYSGDPGNVSKIRPESHHASLVSRIASVGKGMITLERPLPFDIQSSWTPQVRSFEPSVAESGIENLRFEFPKRKYEGHFTELGFNAVALSGVANCWARNLRIVNADSGFMVSGVFCTIQGITFAMDGVTLHKDKVFGHHGIYTGGNDNLFTDFDFQVRFIHDITVSHCSGNVVSNGRGMDLCFDHHKRAPFENLFTNLDAGAGTRLWKCGGGAHLGRHSAARETFWCIRADQPQRHPGGFGPASMNLVALTTDQEQKTEAEGVWFEVIDPGALEPRNLHEAQLARRLGERSR